MESENQPSPPPALLDVVIEDALNRLVQSPDFSGSIVDSLHSLMSSPGASVTSVLDCLSEDQPST